MRRRSAPDPFSSGRPSGTVASAESVFAGCASPLPAALVHPSDRPPAPYDSARYRPLAPKTCALLLPSRPSEFLSPGPERLQNSLLLRNSLLLQCLTAPLDNTARCLFLHPSGSAPSSTSAKLTVFCQTSGLLSSAKRPVCGHREASLRNCSPDGVSLLQYPVFGPGPGGPSGLSKHREVFH